MAVPSFQVLPVVTLETQKKLNHEEHEEKLKNIEVRRQNPGALFHALCPHYSTTPVLQSKNYVVFILHSMLDVYPVK
jgi:hypothetical protein